jgi:hypothetical protein
LGKRRQLLANTNPSEIVTAVLKISIFFIKQPTKNENQSPDKRNTRTAEKI